MNEIIHECQIFAPVSTYSQYIGTDIIHIEANENYQKRSFRNRFDILTANGSMSLTIPLVKGKNNQQQIQEVAISYDENWVVKCLHAIRSAYGKSPYFEFYYDDIEKLLSKKPKYLFDLNVEALSYILQKLKLNIKVDKSTHYLHEYTDIKDLRNFNWSTMISAIKYMQVWDEKFDFMPNLSILDLLFCTGPEALSILQKMNREFNHKH